MQAEKEKQEIYLEERHPSASELSKESEAIPEKGTPERAIAERKLVRKLDCRVLPTIFVIYIMNYIDVRSFSHRFISLALIVSQRNGITTARLKGLEQDLGLTGGPVTTAILTGYSSIVLQRSSVQHHPFASLCLLLPGSGTF